MGLLFDLNYALRTLLNKPKFTFIAVLIMATGLGISVYMIAFLSNLTFKDLPFDKGEEIFLVQAVVDNEAHFGASMNLLDFDEIKSSARSFSDIGAFRDISATVSDGVSSSRFVGINITDNIFDFFKMNAQLGRIFTDADLALTAAPVTVISHSMWVDYFQQRDDVIGQTIKVNGVTTEVIGVMPAKKMYPTEADLWLPAREEILKKKRLSTTKYNVYVRKLPSVTVAQANAELQSIMSRLERQYPDTNTHLSAKLSTVQLEEMGGNAAMIVNAMIYAVILVLILACINVTNLLLVRANERAKETAIRLALGAPRLRLISQMMLESLIICTLGGLIGVLAAAYALEILNVILEKITGGNVPFWWYSELDFTLAMQALAVIVFTAFITGIVPAWKMTRCNVNNELRDGTRGAIGKKSGQITKALVIIEVALSCTLLVVAGVLYLLIEDTKQTDFGISLSNKIHARVVLQDDHYKTDSEKIQLYQRITDELHTIPGVIAAGTMSTLPSNGTSPKRFQPEGFEIVGSNYPVANQVVSFGDSMQALDMQLVEGRFFNQHDTGDSQRVLIITDSLAKKYWPNESALGKRIQLLQGKNKSKWHTVVGVVKHLVYNNGMSKQKYRPTLFHPYAQQTRRFMSNFIVVNNPSKNKLNEISEAIARVDPLVPVYQVNFIEQRAMRRLSGISFIRDIFSVFAVAALFLAATGIYGVLSNSTNRRTQELGIRRALGASDENVLALLMKQGWTQLFIGLLIGLPLGYAVSLGFVQMMLPESQLYYLAYAIVPVMIAVVVMVSTYLPAKKAIALEPSVALRYE